jgi:hypothetical protein
MFEDALHMVMSRVLRGADDSQRLPVATGGGPDQIAVEAVK